jgi:hypothetical protein
MAVRAANVKGIKFLDEPNGNGGVALITFDIAGVAYTAAADTVKLGSGGYDSGVASTDTLAVMISKRRRDGKTVTLTGVCAGGVAPGRQAAATNGPALHVTLAAISTADVASIKLFSAASGGSECTCTASAWENMASIALTYSLT